MLDLLTKIKENLAAELIYDQLSIDYAMRYYNAEGIIERETIHSPNVGFDGLIYNALFNGPHKLYNADGTKIKPELITNSVASLSIKFSDSEEAKSWAQLQLTTNKRLLFVEANPVLGNYKSYVYKQLIDSGQYSMSSDGIYPKDGDSSYLIKCTSCLQAKQPSDLVPGRTICRSCYNANRRAPAQYSTTRVLKPSPQIQEWLRQFNRDQAKRFKEFEEDMSTLNRSFKKDQNRIIAELTDSIATLQRDLKRSLREVLSNEEIEESFEDAD